MCSRLLDLCDLYDYDSCYCEIYYGWELCLIVLVLKLSIFCEINPSCKLNLEFFSNVLTLFDLVIWSLYFMNIFLNIWRVWIEIMVWLCCRVFGCTKFLIIEVFILIENQMRFLENNYVAKVLWHLFCCIIVVLDTIAKLNDLCEFKELYHYNLESKY